MSTTDTVLVATTLGVMVAALWNPFSHWLQTNRLTRLLFGSCPQDDIENRLPKALPMHRLTCWTEDTSNSCNMPSTPEFEGPAKSSNVFGVTWTEVEDMYEKLIRETTEVARQGRVYFNCLYRMKTMLESAEMTHKASGRDFSPRMKILYEHYLQLVQVGVPITPGNVLQSAISETGATKEGLTKRVEDASRKRSEAARVASKMRDVTTEYEKLYEEWNSSLLHYASK